MLEAFGFEEYKFVFEMKYKDLLLKLADIVEQNLVCGNSMDKYVLQDKYEIRNEWQQVSVTDLNTSFQIQIYILQIQTLPANK